MELNDSAKLKRAGTLPVRVARLSRDEPVSVKAGKAEANAFADAAGKTGQAWDPPSKVRVETLGAGQAAALGGVGVGVRVARADGGEDRGRVRLALSYQDFRDAYGGGFAGRLRLVRLPACALATPRPADCTAVPVTVPAVNDVKAGELVADVEVAPAARAGAGGAAPTSEAAIYLLAASAAEAPGAGDGTFAATDLKPSGTWEAGTSGGSFGWSFPLPEPPSPAGNGPDLELSYDSAAVESMSWATNPQSGWAGLGWDLPTAFIERRFPTCSQEGVMPTGLGDLQCWESPDANDGRADSNDQTNSELILSLNGVSGRLVREPASGTWHTEQDTGWKIEQVPGAEAGDAYWKITDQTGMVYRFGYRRDASWQTRYVGDEAGEPCYSSRYSSSLPVCAATWRWNLDQEVDSDGNVIDYSYVREVNNFCWHPTATCTNTGTGPRYASYDRGGYLQRVEWGHNQRIPESVPTTKMEFSSVDRENFEIPGDLQCDTTAACTNRTTAYFITKQLDTVTTYARRPGTSEWDDVAKVDLDYKVVTSYVGDGPQDVRFYLWLDAIRQTGLAGDGQIELPKIGFDAVMLPHKTIWDEFATPQTSYVETPGLGAIDNGLGGRIEITYGQATPCAEGTQSDCWRHTYTYLTWREMQVCSGGVCWTEWREVPATVKLDYQKLLVTKVVEKDLVGGSPDRVTRYQYLGTPAWLTPISFIDPLIGNDEPNEWRGYGKVRTISDAEDPANSTVTTQTFFRGLGATITDFDGNVHPDPRAMAGQVLEERSWRRSTGGVATVTAKATTIPLS
ncbi:SpvB/TcaC N-terminal domain-containing protein [Thermopolyspora sp. NPDC052614]|uniref:SpvB/TcaC N-terminal domain-containing protein n=1 Tax=Thermopolyspora sp. NPDC052614 TaxID=3155682 RepID=UPI0034466BFF